jgi:hypothetical protein
LSLEQPARKMRDKSDNIAIELVTVVERIDRFYFVSLGCVSRL